ncbi:hypothetical protein BC937DRAFT_94223 [Endogone sp. FLAS-F59071]|nr:hypothetical protein BC937DRAFT_94223 [Endogone sp. FLAS-F59071]|eukprot:RUS14181.1 hypothetical protein BC937DRAFT_94223 [Endogone sp. FLAS-F59071]
MLTALMYWPDYLLYYSIAKTQATFVNYYWDELFYLDPHFSRPSLETKESGEYTEQDYSTYHCDVPRKIHISHLDPSMLLGFYCKTRTDFDAFCARVAKKHTPIFTIDEQAPEYEDDVRSEDDFGVMSGEDGVEGEEGELVEDDKGIEEEEEVVVAEGEEEEEEEIEEEGMEEEVIVEEQDA